MTLALPNAERALLAERKCTADHIRAEIYAIVFGVADGILPSSQLAQLAVMISDLQLARNDELEQLQRVVRYLLP